MPRVLYCARTCPPLEPPYPLPPPRPKMQQPPAATPSTQTRRHVNLDDSNSPTSPLPPDPNHQQPYYESHSDTDDEYWRPTSPEYDGNYSYDDEDEGSFDPYHENLPYYANIALEHYNSQDKHQIKYRLVKGIVSHNIMYDGSYYHLNFTAKSTLENSKEEFFFAELRFDFDIKAWLPVSIVALEENERVGGFGNLRDGVDPRHCFNCGDQLKHPLDGSLYEAGHYIVDNFNFHRYIEVLPATQPDDVQK